MNNLVINTQDAIDAICDEFQYVYCHNCAHQDDEEQCEYCHRKNMYWSVSRTTVERILNKLPPAQPVLTCKGCKYDYYEYAGCRNCLRRERDLYEPE